MRGRRVGTDGADRDGGRQRQIPSVAIGRIVDVDFEIRIRVKGGRVGTEIHAEIGSEARLDKIIVFNERAVGTADAIVRRREGVDVGKAVAQDQVVQERRILRRHVKGDARIERGCCND